jgi:predicted KAP-like P-loop ATPase
MSKNNNRKFFIDIVQLLNYSNGIITDRLTLKKKYFKKLYLVYKRNERISIFLISLRKLLKNKRYKSILLIYEGVE